MSDLKTVKTEILNESDPDILSTKLAAVNNKVRFSILEILRDFENANRAKDGSFKNEPLYSREINSLLLNNYNINITTQMLVEDLFLDVNFLSDELLTFFDLYKFNQRFSDGEHCVFTIFNGVDKGKTFKVHKDETVLIGRKANYDANDLASFTILLDNSYSTVSNVSKPHLKVFYKDDGWYILDSCSSNGTYIADKKVPIGIETKLKTNSFLKLSKGNGAAVIYCSF